MIHHFDSIDSTNRHAIELARPKDVYLYPLRRDFRRFLGVVERS